MSSPALRIQGLSKSFGGLDVFRDLNFELARGDVLGVIGPNGAGKTTLVNVLSNQIDASAGQTLLHGKRITGLSFPATARLGLVRSFQHTSVFPTATVAENMIRARRFAQRPVTLPTAALKLIECCGLHVALDRKAGDLPYGSQKMLGLVMSCLTEPKVLLLDEPAAGLELKERNLVDVLVAHARDSLSCSIIIVEHDMDLIRRICRRSIVLEGGRILAEGETSKVLSEPAVINAYLGESAEESNAAH